MFDLADGIADKSCELMLICVISVPASLANSQSGLTLAMAFQAADWMNAICLGRRR